MRTTFTMVNRNVQQNLSRRYSDMVQLQEQLATGKRLRKPSDDPVDVANDIKLRTKQTQLKQYQRNIEDGLAIMGVASSAMGSMNELLHRMRELAVQGANDTNTAADRQYIQQETDQLFRQMLTVINTQFKGDYIFNGTQTKIPPYEIKASTAELKNYLDINGFRKDAMATYGGDYIRDTSDAAVTHPGSFLYLDYDTNPLKIGDKIQMKWANPLLAPGEENINATYIFPDTLPLDTIDIDTGGGVFETFHKYNGIDDPAHPLYNAHPDYVVDHRTGEVTILSERFKNTLNSIVPDPAAENTRLTAPFVTRTPGADPYVPGLKYSVQGTVQIISGKDGTPITNILPGSLNLKIGGREYLEGFGEYQPDYYDEKGVLQKGKNVYDYSVNYVTGEITIYNMDLMRDMRPEVAGKNDYRVNPNNPNYDPRFDIYTPSPDRDVPYKDAYDANSPYRPGQLALTFEHITRGVNIHGDKVASHGQIYRAVEEGIATQINLGVDEILRDKWTGLDMIGTLMRYNQAMRTDDRDGIQNSITELSSMYDAVLNAQSQMGARIYRLELTLTRNQEQYVEVSTQQSALEDADLAETISKLMLAQNVYNAALQAAMRVIQPSLANFM